MGERLNAGEVCTREVTIAFRHTELVTAAQLMREAHVGALVVVDEAQGIRTVAGLLTDRDIVTAVIAPGMDPGTLTVGEVMSEPAVTVGEDASLIDLMRTMRDHGVRRVPVVGERQALLGLVTLDDALEVLAEELSLLVATIRNENRRERQRRQ
ncbi:MAG: CBS domain-containing protein [Aquabacterium sp.]|jgi:CBS domain-containing protein|uniref:CBS domain-containing protein n=1 Tax=Aquabacterium sp. TaxID=1872578 RepID=UPI002A35A268|nr:CBS domain-containing protein [Aquabacterium sp.]MDX9844287.1 CBS domain-containing protein [Aquabacterium sp.]